MFSVASNCSRAFRVITASTLCMGVLRTVKRQSLSQLVSLALVVVIQSCCLPVHAENDGVGAHLFILSGQSNMAGMKPKESFTPAVEKEFGKENVIVVKDAHGGQPIRRWYKDWKSADGSRPDKTGDLYDRLIEKVKAETTNGDRKIGTVTFVWMQGERDAKEEHGEIYAASLQGLFEQLVSDLGRDDLNFVIGRLSDFDLPNQNYPHWTLVREQQVALAEKNENCVWVDTDDLNDGKNRSGKTIKNDLHYSAEGYVILGQRFADQAIQMVKSRLAGDAASNGTQANDVLFMVLDDLNDWISLLDPKSPITTPNMERLAERGVLFTHAYCASPACNPSRSATLTGLRPTTSGVYGNKSDWRHALPERKTIMQHFIDAGFHVTGAGKIFHHHLDGAFHDDDSFHEFQHMRAQKYPDTKLNGAPDYGSRNTDWGRWPAREEDSIDFHTADFCIKVLKDPPKDKPVFLACGIYKPHSPFFAPSIYHKPYEQIRMPLRRPNDWNDVPSGAETLLRNKKWFWRGMMSVEKQQKGSYENFIRSYAACAAFADAQVGRVLDALDSSPRGDKTTVVLWSDHGFHLGEKDHIEKFALWEKSNHIPLIVVAPGIAKAGVQCASPVDLMTIYPTLLDLAGLPADPTCDGISLRPLLENPKAQREIPALMTYMRGNHAVRSDRWRYIRYSDGTEELYDHDVDPNEWENLASDRRYTDVLRQHRTWLPRAEAQQVRDLKPKSVSLQRK